jgi:hypothetical protein
LLVMRAEGSFRPQDWSSSVHLTDASIGGLGS